MIADDLTPVGMKVDVRAVPFATLVDRVARQRDFDALLVGITVGNDPDPYPFFHSKQVTHPGDTFSGYSPPAMDRLPEQARRAVHQAKPREPFAPTANAGGGSAGGVGGRTDRDGRMAVIWSTHLLRLER